MVFRDYDGETPAATALATRREVSPWVLAVIVFLLGIALTGWLAIGEKHRRERAEQQAFVDQTEQVAAAIRLQLAQCGQRIRAFQTIFQVSGNMTQDVFVLAHENLQVNSVVPLSLQALAYAERRRSPTGDHYITTMFAPQGGNESILGLDLSNQPSNLESLQRAGDTNLVSMSAPFHLRQSDPAQTSEDGFILRLPIYARGAPLDSVESRRSAIIGSIGASFRISSLIAPTLREETATLADLEVVDVSSSRPRSLYSQHLAAPGDKPPISVRLSFGGRTWNVIAHAREIPARQSSWVAVLWAGGMMSALLAALAWSLVSTRERAVRLGESMSERFRTSEERFRKLNELLPCLVLVARKDDGEIVYRNAVARSRLAADTDWAGLSASLNAEMDSRLRPGEQDGNVLQAVDVLINGANGKSFWASTWITSVDLDGIPMWLLVASDISEQRKLTERLTYQASHDSLTKLYNRREFEARAQVLMGQGESRDGALLFMDLDQFKLINDTSGHRAGDELLVQLATVMRDKLRPDDVLGRLGGDEFGVLLAGASTVDAAMHAAERLRQSIEAFVFSWEKRTYMISASVGLVLLKSASSVKELFAHADTACYMAKEAGRNRIHAYTENNAAISNRMGEMEWATRIRDALRDDRLLLDYQELHPLQPQRGKGAYIELLLRLRSEDGSVVSPGAFLPAAERFGLMPLIDRWVVETALANIDHLHPEGSGLSTCAINLSGASLEDDGLIARIEQLIELHGLDPRRLMFEITETMAVRNFAAASALIARLRSLGCRVALDDFGAGMSSFGYLKNLELDVVKIDGSFVQSIATDPMSQTIVKAVAEIAHQQGLDVVAEWVSSRDMLDILATMSVDFAQGFALHRPERTMFQRDANG